MPVFMTPAHQEDIEGKDVRPDGFLADGPFAEHFTIRAFLTEGVAKGARTAATTTITRPGGRVEESFDLDVYARELISSQLTGFRIISPGKPPDMSDAEYLRCTETHHDTGDLRWWVFGPEVIRRFPWDVRAFLRLEIERCGGILATADLLVETTSGQTLRFRGTPEGVGATQAPQISDTSGNGVLPQAGAGGRVQGAAAGGVGR